MAREPKLFSQPIIHSKGEIASMVTNMIHDSRIKKQSADVLATEIVDLVWRLGRFKEQISPELEKLVIEKLRELPRLTYKEIGEQLGMSANLVNRISRDQVNKNGQI